MTSMSAPRCDATAAAGEKPNFSSDQTTTVAWFLDYCRIAWLLVPRSDPKRTRPGIAARGLVS
ncbi:hypothetical protein ACX0FC_17065, partial [Enterococcus faecium]